MCALLTIVYKILLNQTLGQLVHCDKEAVQFDVMGKYTHTPIQLFIVGLDAHFNLRQIPHTFVPIGLGR